MGNAIAVYQIYPFVDGALIAFSIAKASFKL